MTIVDDGAGSALLDSGDQPDAALATTNRGRHMPVIALLVGAAALGAAVFGAGWWWSHPSVYGGVSDEFGAHLERLTPVYVGMVSEPEVGRVDVVDAEPRVRVFGGAEADVLLCNEAQIGIVDGDDVEHLCFAPGVPREDSRWDQVVLRVTPLEAGTVVVVDGIDLTYSTPFQRGTEHTGSAGVVVFPDE